MKNTNEYMRQYMADYRKKLKKSGIKKSNVTEFGSYYQKLRKKVFELYGGKCCECECDVFAILELNHLRGKGNKDVLFLKSKNTF